MNGLVKKSYYEAMKEGRRDHISPHLGLRRSADRKESRSISTVYGFTRTSTKRNMISATPKTRDDIYKIKEKKEMEKTRTRVSYLTGDQI